VRSREGHRRRSRGKRHFALRAGASSSRRGVGIAGQNAASTRAGARQRGEPVPTAEIEDDPPRDEGGVVEDVPCQGLTSGPAAGPEGRLDWDPSMLSIFSQRSTRSRTSKVSNSGTGRPRESRVVRDELAQQLPASFRAAHAIAPAFLRLWRRAALRQVKDVSFHTLPATATPTLTETFRTLSGIFALSTAARSRSARSIVCRISRSGHTTTNSSPPARATTSLAARSPRARSRLSGAPCHRRGDRRSR